MYASARCATVWGGEPTRRGTVMGFIKTFLPALDDKTLYVMARDIAEADNLGDAEIDAPMWAAFLTEIENERKRRKSDENA